MKKTTAFPAINAGFSISGALSLLAGVGLLVASGISLQASLRDEGVRVDLASWSYLAQIRINLDRASTPAEADLRVLQNGQFTFADARSVSEQTYAPKVTAHFVRRASMPRNRQAVARIARSISKQVAQVTTQDRIPAVQAAPIHVPAAKLIKTPAAQPQAEASPSQIEAFQKMHDELRLQFLTAVRAVPGVTIHVATQAEVQADMVVANQAPPVHVARPTAPHRDHAKPARIIISRPTLRPSKRLPPARSAAVATPMAATLAISPLSSQAQIVETASLMEAPIAARVSVAQLAEAVKVKVAQGTVARTEPAETNDKPYVKIAELSKVVFVGMEAPVQRRDDAPADKAPTAQALIAAAPQMATQGGESTVNKETVQKTANGASILVSTSNGYSPGSRGDYSSSTLFKMWQAWNAREQATPTSLPQGQLIAQATPSPPEEKRSDVEPSYDALPLAAVVEAYEWKTPVTSVSSEDVTLEGWKRLRAADHWPVLHWSPDAQARTAMISHNAAVLLARLADVQLQPDAAIVFGKIPAGWTVEFSDRAEKVIYTDETNRLDATSEGSRYFTFLNAAPGAQLITLKAVLGAETASVAAPVLNGSSTYLDLTSVSKRPFNGYVLDATTQSRKGISGAAVSVIGQPNAVFFATESGYFNLSEVYAIGSYPVYVETSTAQGFKHRYRVTPDKMESMELFRMGDAQVQGWVSQLEGGVSPDSGMIVAAMPKLTRRYGDGRLFAGTRSLLLNRTLNPETYLISEEGALDAGKPLEIAASRFISVQVPAGPVVTHVEDNNRNIVWSQLVLAQPGVVNVVGPY